MPFDTSMYQNFRGGTGLAALGQGITQGLEIANARKQQEMQAKQQELQQQAAQRQQEAHGAEQAERAAKIQNTIGGQLGEWGGQFLAIQDPNQREAAWGAKVAELESMGVPKQYLPSTAQAAAPFLQFHNSKYQQSQQDEALKRRKMEAEINETNARARKAGTSGGDPIAQALSMERLEKMKRDAEEAAFKKSPQGRLQGMNSGDKARYDNVVGSLRAITGMESAFENGDNTFSLIGDNDFTRNRAVWEEMVGRMQSGGAITDEEAKRFRSLVPTFKDSKDQQQKKLSEMREIMESRFGTMGFAKTDAESLGLNPAVLGFNRAPKTKEWNGVVYVQQNGHWVPQAPQVAGGR